MTENPPEPPVDSRTAALFDTMRPLLRSLAAYRNLSSGKMRALDHLVERGPMTMSELAGSIRVSQQGTSLAVRELERLELVTRVPDPNDRRRSWIHITDAGRHLLHEEHADAVERLDRVVDEHLSDDERRDLFAAIPVLRKLAAKVADE